MKTLLIFFIIVIIGIVIKCSEKESLVVIITKKYVPAWIGVGEMSEDEKFMLYVKKIDGTSFIFHNNTEII